MKNLLILTLISFFGFSTFSQSITLDPSSTFSVDAKKTEPYNSVSISNSSGIGGYLFRNNLGSAFAGLYAQSASQNMYLIANNFGIGTFNNPIGKVEIATDAGASHPTLLLKETNSVDGSRIAFYNNNSSYYTLWGNPNATLANSTFNLDYSGFGPIMTWKGSGNVGIGETSPDAKLEVNGYTKLGGESNVPKIKMKKLTGTTASSQGQNSLVAHGLNVSKILDVRILIETSSTSFVPDHSEYANVKSTFELDNNYLRLRNVEDKSSGILSKPFKALITYEE